MPEQLNASLSSVILVVTRNGHLSEPAMDHALNVADRLNFRILVAHVNTMPFLWDGGRRTRLFNSAVLESISTFRAKAASKGMEVSFVSEAGKISNVIYRLCHIVRKIEFVLIDKGIKREEAASRAPVPVFDIYCRDHAPLRVTGRKPSISAIREEYRSAPSWKRYAVKATAYGVLAVGLYSIFFLQSENILRYCTKGGAYAFLPLLTVCIFFFVQRSCVLNVESALILKRAAVSRQVRAVEQNCRVDDNSFTYLSSVLNNQSFHQQPKEKNGKHFQKNSGRHRHI